MSNLVKLLFIVTLHCLTEFIQGATGSRQCSLFKNAYDSKLLNVSEVADVGDGCNKCLCTEHGLACTGLPCSGSFARPGVNLYGECQYKPGVWYPFRTQWRDDDGCNTCTCVAIGNYQGQFQCTNGVCFHGPNNAQAQSVG